MEISVVWYPMSTLFVVTVMNIFLYICITSVKLEKLLNIDLFLLSSTWTETIIMKDFLETNTFPNISISQAKLYICVE